jgi:hypothetical protein
MGFVETVVGCETYFTQTNQELTSEILQTTKNIGTKSYEDFIKNVGVDILMKGSFWAILANGAGFKMLKDPKNHKNGCTIIGDENQCTIINDENKYIVLNVAITGGQSQAPRFGPFTFGYKISNEGSKDHPFDFYMKQPNLSNFPEVTLKEIMIYSDRLPTE